MRRRPVIKDVLGFNQRVEKDGAGVLDVLERVAWRGRLQRPADGLPYLETALMGERLDPMGSLQT